MIIPPSPPPPPPLLVLVLVLFIAAKAPAGGLTYSISCASGLHDHLAQGLDL